MKELICISHGGLADRLMMIAVGRVFAKYCGAKFTFVWVPNGHCGARYFDVLNIPPDTLDIVQDGMYRKDAPLLEAGDMPWEKVESIVFNWPTEALRLCAFPKAQLPSNFKFKDDIESEVSGFLKSSHAGGWELIGVHVRAGDYSERTPDLVDYVEQIDKLSLQLPAALTPKIFLATDSLIVRKWFQRVCGERLLLYPCRSYDRAKPEAVIDAAIELSILRRCGKLILSGYSGFSRLASHRYVDPDSKGIVVVEDNAP